MRNCLPLITIIALYLLVSCAKQTAPTGGPKDETPPKLISTTPTNKSINFNSSSIELTFDELIQINNAREQLIITPSVGKKFELLAKKNTATLKFNAELLPNTTYTLLFRESIQDLNEKNSATNLKLAFSTGAVIDSLSIKGKVKELLTDKELANITIGLAPASDTFSIFKHPAQSLSLSEKDGTFLLENLKAGEYWLYAFKDKNKDLRVDSKTEPYAFLSEPLNLTANIEKLNLELVKQDVRPNKLISAKPIADYFNIKTTKGILSYTVDPIDTAIHLSHQAIDDTNIKIYYTELMTDSTQIKFSVTDSTAFRIDTTLTIKFGRKPGKLKDKYTYSVENAQYLQSATTFRASLSFNKPTGIRYDTLYLTTDSTTTIPIKPENVTWNYSKTKATITVKDLTLTNKSKEPQKGTPTYSPPLIQFIAGVGAFRSIEIDSSKRLNQNVTVFTPDNSGVILVNTKVKGSFITQVVDQNFKVVQETINQTLSTFENLPPANYQIRVILDTNNNGKWDAGHYSEKLQPEKIVFYQSEKKEKTINLKANWEVGPLLITTE